MLKVAQAAFAVVCQMALSTQAGAEEAILHWSGRISGHFECMEKCIAILIGT